MVQLTDAEVCTSEVKSWKGLHLLHFEDSLCSRKCRLFLAEKQLKWESHHVHLMKLEQQTDWFLGVNPRGLVPVLVHNGQVHIESNDIMFYLDDTFDGTKLLPQDAGEKKLAQEMLELDDNLHLDIRTLTFSKAPYEKVKTMAKLKVEKIGGTDAFHGTIGGVPETDVGGQALDKQLGFWQQLLERPFTETEKEDSKTRILAVMDKAEEVLGSKEYLLGDRLTLVDITLFITMERFTNVTDHDLSASHPALHKLHQRLILRPAFQAEAESLAKKGH